MKHLLIILLLNTLLLATMGRVTAISGTAELQRTSQTIDVIKGIDILEKDHLSTAKRSRVQVILNDDTVVTVGPSSEYLFELYSELGDGEVLMKIERGFFKTVTGKIGKIAPQRFKIKTKAATIGIRGTQFMAYVQKEEEVIGCIQGEIVVWTDEGKFYVVAGKMIVYRNRHWSIKDMDMDAFAPVMIGMYGEEKKATLAQKRALTPRNSYPLEEQIIKDNTEEVTQEKALSFLVTSKVNNDIPTFLYADFIVNPLAGTLDPFLLTHTVDGNIPAYLLQENSLDSSDAPFEAYYVNLDNQEPDGTTYLPKDTLLNDSVSPLEPYNTNLGANTIEEMTPFGLEEQMLNNPAPVTEPYNLNLGTHPTTTLPPFSP